METKFANIYGEDHSEEFGGYKVVRGPIAGATFFWRIEGIDGMFTGKEKAKAHILTLLSKTATIQADSTLPPTEKS
jgi:hypothetical protein